MGIVAEAGRRSGKVVYNLPSDTCWLPLVRAELLLREFRKFWTATAASVAPSAALRSS